MWSGPTECKFANNLCKLKNVNNAPTLAIRGVDTADNEISNVTVLKNRVYRMGVTGVIC